MTQDFKECWCCGRQLKETASICECGIDHWRYPLPVPVTPNRFILGKWEVKYDLKIVK